MAQGNAASKRSVIVETAQNLRLVHNSGQRSAQPAPGPARLFLVEPPLAAPPAPSGTPMYRRLVALLHLLLPHMPVI